MKVGELGLNKDEFFGCGIVGWDGLTGRELRKGMKNGNEMK